MPTNLILKGRPRCLVRVYRAVSHSCHSNRELPDGMLGLFGCVQLQYVIKLKSALPRASV